MNEKAVKRTQEWAEKHLHEFYPQEQYPYIFAKLRSKSYAQRLSRVDIMVLRLLKDNKFRPPRPPAIEQKYSFSAMVTRMELCEVIECHPATIHRSVQRLNRLARQNANASASVRKYGLILFSNYGYAYQPKLSDTELAKSYSQKQMASQNEAHQFNIRLADEKRKSAIAAGAETGSDLMRRFASLSVAEQAKLLQQVSA